MKTVKVFAVSLVLGLFMASVSYAEDIKMGFADLSRMFDEYHKTKSYDKVLEGKQKDFEKARNDKIEAVKEKQSKLDLLAKDKRGDAEKEIQKLKDELLEYDQQIKTDLTKARNEMIREILLEIEKVVSEFAQKEKYGIILNDRVLIYGNDGFNLTETLLKLLNAGQPAGDEKAKPAK